MMRFTFTAIILAALVMPGAALAERKLPYWASISAGKARMRSGPGRQFPATWMYQRVGLPVKVLEIYPNWRKIEDPDGTTGWVQGNLLSDNRTAIVMGGIHEMRGAADASAPVVWRAEPGVVGALTQCDRGWCLFDVKGRTGYIEIAHIWGAKPDERLP
ncbi:SH3 domain-containing protein [Sphingomonas sp.]|uniref:SH3 domain-containing protein n=1 Tax=Sphingomonas sp. TaxID=28214 RepID=UPI0025F2412B|nr:SH3 domain-containing protein [Sphingomonas sp.]